MAWSQICREKDVGGLGIKDLKAFNHALMGKWWWRLKIEGDSFWVRVLKEKYGVEGGVGEKGWESTIKVVEARF